MYLRFHNGISSWFWPDETSSIPCLILILLLQDYNLESTFKIMKILTQFSLFLHGYHNYFIF